MELHHFFLFLSIILIAARLFSETAARFGILSVIGELLAGLLIGSSHSPRCTAVPAQVVLQPRD
jgi:Kef-type K+ transport system membrane component KefB